MQPKEWAKCLPFSRALVLKVRCSAEGRELREDFDAFRELSATAGGRCKFDWSDRWSCLDDRTSDTLHDHYQVLSTPARLPDFNDAFHALTDRFRRRLRSDATEWSTLTLSEIGVSVH